MNSTISIAYTGKVIMWTDYYMGLGWKRISGRDFDIVWMSSPSKAKAAWILGWKGYSYADWRANAIEDATNLFYQRPAL